MQASAALRRALRELPSPGKSGSVFFLSDDDRFMIKTVRKEEMRLLLELIPEYYAHCHNNPDTLLTRFYGVHRVKPINGLKARVLFLHDAAHMHPNPFFLCQSNDFPRMLSAIPSLTFGELFACYNQYLRGSKSVRMVHQVRFVVMGNVFPTEVPLHRKFDLKGSTLGRTAGPKANEPGATLKARLCFPPSQSLW